MTKLIIYIISLVIFIGIIISKGVVFIFNDYYDDIPKYRKKKKKKRVKKANHKHQYTKEVLFKTNDKSRYHYGTICSICGKLGKENYFEAEKVEGEDYYRMLTQEEILEKYKGLPIIEKNI